MDVANLIAFAAMLFGAVAFFDEYESTKQGCTIDAQCQAIYGAFND